MYKKCNCCKKFSKFLPKSILLKQNVHKLRSPMKIETLQMQQVTARMIEIGASLTSVSHLRLEI